MRLVEKPVSPQPETCAGEGKEWKKNNPTSSGPERGAQADDIKEVLEEPESKAKKAAALPAPQPEASRVSGSPATRTPREGRPVKEKKTLDAYAQGEQAGSEDR